MKFSFIYRSGATLKETPLDHLYAVEFGNWKEEAAEWYAEWCDIFGDLTGKKIIGFELDKQSGVRRVTYEGGTNIYVNYYSAAAEMDGITVPGAGYVKAGTN